MTFDFTVKEFILGNGTGTPTFQFYRRGWNLGGEGGSPTPSWRDVVIKGVGALTLVNAKAGGLNYLKLFGGTEQLPETYIDSVTLDGKCEQRNLPEGYTEYDGLIGDGNAYIDLDCAMTQDDELEIEFTKTSNIISKDLGGYRTSATSNNISTIIASSGNVVADFNNSDYTSYRLNQAISLNTRYKVVINKTGRYVYQGSTLVGSNTTACNDTIACPTCCLFKLGGSGLAGNFIGIIHRASIKGKRDVVPCYNGTEYGMYDRLNGVFYPNANTTGSFTVGNAVVPSPTTPVNIVCNNGAIKFSPNEFNPNAVELGYYRNVTTGAITPSPWNFITDFMPVKPNTSYVCYGKRKSDNIISSYNRVYWFDSNKNFISTSSYNVNTITVATSPANAYYAQAGINESGGTSIVTTQEIVDGYNWVFQEGTAEVTYQPYVEGGIYTDGTTETVTDSNGLTATAQMLLSVGNYKDTQEILSGAVTRNICIKVFDGTETFINGQYGWITEDVQDQYWDNANPYAPICSHFVGTSDTPTSNSNTVRVYRTSNQTGRIYFGINKTIYTSTDVFKQYLADQYNAGTPVIIVYPLATATTETVTGQFLSKSPVTYSGSITGLTGTVVESSHTTPTPQQPLQINCNNGVVKVSPNLVEFNETRINGSTWDSADKTKGFEVEAAIYAKVVGSSVITNANCFGAFVPCKLGESVSINFFDYTVYSARCYYCEVDIDGKATTAPVQYATNQNVLTQQTFTITQPNSIGFAIEWYISSSQVRNYTKENYMVVRGSTPPTKYMPYGTIYADGTTETVEVFGKNLFNKNIANIEGAFAQGSDTIVTNANYRIYDYSYIKAGSYVLQLNNPYGSGTATVMNLYNKSKTYLSQAIYTNSRQVGLNTWTFTVAQDGYYRLCCRYTDENIQIEQGSTATTYKAYYYGGQATAEDLLKVGTYQDVQSVLDGEVTRNVGILVFDGVTNGKKLNETWNSTYKRGNLTVSGMASTASGVDDALCNLFDYSSSVYGSPTTAGFCTNNGTLFISFLGLDSVTSSSTANDWLAQQYQAGNPVVVLYPLATPTTETVTAQPLTIQAGSNVVEITQASMDNLELEVSYKETI